MIKKVYCWHSKNSCIHHFQLKPLSFCKGNYKWVYKCICANNLSVGLYFLSVFYLIWPGWYFSTVMLFLIDTLANIEQLNFHKQLFSRRNLIETREINLRSLLITTCWWSLEVSDYFRCGWLGTLLISGHNLTFGLLDFHFHFLTIIPPAPPRVSYRHFCPCFTIDFLHLNFPVWMFTAALFMFWESVALVHHFFSMQMLSLHDCHGNKVCKICKTTLINYFCTSE